MNEFEIDSTAVVDLDELRGVVRSLLAQESSSARVRSLLDDPVGYDTDLWSRFAELGWCGIAVPEAFGGAGGSFTEFGVVMQEMGRHLTGGPLVPTVALGVGALLLAGTEDQKARWLPRLASGEIKATGVLTGMSGRPDPREPAIRVEMAHDRFVVSGEAAFVPEAQAADLFVVAARHDSGRTSLFLIERSEVEVVVTPTVDQTRRLGQVRLVNVEAPVEALLGHGEGAPAVVDGLINRMAVGLACDSLGGARRMMEMTAAYTCERVQFGRPIGTFQAVKHRVADMLVDVEASDVAVERALRSFHADERGNLDDGSIAAVYANDAFARVAGAALQLHGGIGFTWEHDTHLFLKRAKLNQALFGDTAWHRQRLAAGLLARRGP